MLKILKKLNLLKIISLLLLIVTFTFSQNNKIYFENLKAKTDFILVIDKSGSMSGEAISNAKKALKEFIRDVKGQDKIAIIEFSDKNNIKQKLTSNKNSLYKAVESINAGGGTRLYDAVGRALMEVRNSDKSSVIVFMTDGQDGGSALNASDLANMCPSQGVFVYGIGLGNVDKNALKSIATATGGDYEYTTGSKNLGNLYLRVLNSYYKNVGNTLSQRSQIVIRAIPPGQIVYINEQRAGETPLLVSNLKKGNYPIRVEFPNGDWKQDIFLPEGKKAFIDARESDIPKNIAILSVPHNAMAFIDGQFVGYTSISLTKKNQSKKGFIFKKEIITEDFSRELIIPAIPKGRHKLKIVAISDNDFNNIFRPLEYNFYMGDKNLILHADCRTGDVKTKETDVELKPSGRKSTNPFDELDDDFEEDLDF